MIKIGVNYNMLPEWKKRMILKNFKLPLVFVHTPKCAGTYARNYLEQFGIRNLRHNKAKGDEGYIFTIIRDPVERFESLLNYRLGEERIREDWPKKLHYVYQDKSVNLNQIVEQMTDKQILGFTPYYSLLYWSENVNMFITVEEFIPFLELCGYKITKRYEAKNISKKERGVLNEECRNRVRELYKGDDQFYQDWCSNKLCIKLYAERNSGTNYLDILLRNNLLNVTVASPYYRGRTGWKHGFPKLDQFDIDNTIFICIVRDLESWLNSMFNNPHHLVKKEDFYKFITEKCVIDENRVDHDLLIVSEEQNKNLFQLRYDKYKRYKDLLKKGKGVIVSLKYLQNNTEKFLQQLCDNFLLSRKQFVDIVNHTKSGRVIQNEEYQTIEVEGKLIEDHIDLQLEKEIHNLTVLFSNTLLKSSKSSL